MKTIKIYHILILIILLLSNQIAFGKKNNYKKFSITFHEQDDRIEKILAKEIKLEILRMQKKYNLDIDNFDVFIMESEDKFKKEFQKDFPDWAIAAAKYPSRKIIIKSPNFSKQYIPELRQTIIHEMVHIALEPIIKNKYFPRWLNEGMAQYEAEQFSIRKKILLNRITLYSDYMNLTKIDDVLKFNKNRADLAYAQSVSAFKFLIEEFGEDAYRRFLIFIGEGQETDVAFKHIYKFSLEEFESYWKLWAHKQYRFYILIDINALIWMFLPLLVIIAWLLVKQRNRIKLRKWEDEEFLKMLSENQKDYEN